MNADELKIRTKDFALRVIKLVLELPKTVEGRAIANQIVRSGTSVAANYRATCRARSRTEFVAKIGIVLEEADRDVIMAGTDRCYETLTAAARGAASQRSR